MASANNDKEKTPWEEDLQDPKLKEGQMAGGSRAREPTFVGSTRKNARALHRKITKKCSFTIKNLHLHAKLAI
jgi:hypothetical protein